MTMPQYREFLNFFNSLNCQFLYVHSCFAGGKNILNLLKKDIDEEQKIFDITSINYIVAMGATTDTEMTSFLVFEKDQEAIKKKQKKTLLIL